jgi:glycolate oxidase iron-sulfur subunit
MKSLDELTTKCIRCGFCLESCPTFVVTGEETESPRGRIYLARSADEGKLDWEATRAHLEACLGCRACETACPSGVEYGQILEIARVKLEESKPSRAKHAFLSGMTHPKRLMAQLALSSLLPGRKIPRMLSKLLSGEAPAADKPRVQPDDLLPLDESECPPIRGEVYLLEGCATRVLYPRVHAATRRLLRRVGYTVRETSQGCCGALHAHSGFLDEANEMASRLASAMPDNLPIIVNSAGCGSWLKESSLPGRAVDATEFLLANGLVDALTRAPGLGITATYHDACHLAHGQGVRSQPRELLAAIPKLKLVELNEADMCCGSAGIYNITQPHMAKTLLDRKWANVAVTKAAVVATGNPGCHAWIAQAAREHGESVQVLHTLELLEAAFSGLP